MYKYSLKIQYFLSVWVPKAFKKLILIMYQIYYIYITYIIHNLDVKLASIIVLDFK